MKPLHVGLLVVGAALAGGLAVKMSQPPALSPQPPRKAVITAPVASPVTAAPAKPVTSPAPATLTDADAPPPVYAEPEHTAQAAPKRDAKPKQPVSKPTPSLPKVQPVQIAKASSPAQPSLPLPSPIPYQQPAPVLTPPAQPVPDAEPAHTPELPPVRQVVMQPGTTLPIRLLQTISSEHAIAGDTFQASLADPLVIDGLVIAERGARVSGRVTEARSSGRFSGSSLLQLSLSTIETADGQRVNITTEPWVKQSDSNAQSRNDAVRIGGGAALGAIIGAIAGGGKGAAIGAGAGGAAGAGSVAVSHPRPLEIPTETLIRFRLASRVTITERPL